MQQASYLEGGPLLLMLPLYLHVNQKSDDDNDDCINLAVSQVFPSLELHPKWKLPYLSGYKTGVLSL